MMANRLAKLAVSRVRLQNSISTASAVGDSKWARNNRPALDALDKRIDALKRVLPASIINEAREITNAPI